MHNWNTSDRYFVVPDTIRRAIYDSTELERQPLRPQIFDFDDFVIKAKEAVVAWACGHICIDGYGPLHGIFFGSQKGVGYGYNWSLSQDMETVAFFDAQTGEDLTGSNTQGRFGSSKDHSMDSTTISPIHEAPPRPAPLVEGLYILTNKQSKTCLRVAHDSGMKIEGLRRAQDKEFISMLWQLRRTEGSGNYILTNVKGPVDLVIDPAPRKGSGPSLVTLPPPSQGSTTSANMEWIIREVSQGFYTLMNAATDTCLELQDSSGKHGPQAQLFAFTEGKDAQLWSLDRRSRFTGEVLDAVVKDPLFTELFIPYPVEAQYYVLPDRLWHDIYDATGLEVRALRRRAFDYDDFVVRVKDAMTQWVCENINIDDYSVLFGLIYGMRHDGGYAYNWTLSQDMLSPVFFDAQNGQELTPAALERLAFKSRFSTC
ncbi:hypothetical protein FRB99_000835 [Tulasnella sp. 403]|nr:hypothetical protein FRB99_000835 [Tulasnella sp. 403]